MRVMARLMLAGSEEIMRRRGNRTFVIDVCENVKPPALPIHRGFRWASMSRFADSWATRRPAPAASPYEVCRWSCFWTCMAIPAAGDRLGRHFALQATSRLRDRVHQRMEQFSTKPPIFSLDFVICFLLHSQAKPTELLALSRRESTSTSSSVSSQRPVARLLSSHSAPSRALTATLDEEHAKMDSSFDVTSTQAGLSFPRSGRLGLTSLMRAAHNGDVEQASPYVLLSVKLCLLHDCCGKYATPATCLSCLRKRTRPRAQYMRTSAFQENYDIPYRVNSCFVLL